MPSQVYDSDGNFLQALDSLEMQALLPSFLEQVARSTDKTLPECKFVDLGCGTGRNTLVLQRAAPQSRIIGLEPSEKMREIARQRMDEQIASSSSDGGKEEQQLVSFEAYDMLQQKQTNEAPVADGVISTLVLEHVPLSTFFTSAASMLTPNGGILLLTNMHSAMGAISQAGFVHPVTKVKIRPTSYAHTVDEVIAAVREGWSWWGR
jgi:2-polyprenyl-3-methyl-5-hydroxy-6-metoxy-1,4-benzoquinol methylase